MLVLCFSLYGCGTTVNSEPTVTLHPDLPAPVDVRIYDWKIIEDDNKVYVGLKYQDYLDFAQDRQSILKYIRESNNVICFYRKGEDLNDSICVEPP